VGGHLLLLSYLFDLHADISKAFRGFLGIVLSTNSNGKHPLGKFLAFLLWRRLCKARQCNGLLGHIVALLSSSDTMVNCSDVALSFGRY